MFLLPKTRITSYNVCYTKLLRQGYSTLLDGLAEQVHRPELRGHILHLAAGNDHGRVFQHWHNPALRAVVFGRGEHQDGLAVFRHCRPTEEIDDPGHTREVVERQSYNFV